MAKIEAKHVATGSAAAVIALAGGLIYNFEGERSASIATSWGSRPTVSARRATRSVEGLAATKNACRFSAAGSKEFNAAIDKCVHVPLSTGQRGASLSFTYNLGAGAYCNGSVSCPTSTPVILQAACDAMLLYNRAGGREIRGLTLRRQAERKVCLGG